MTQLELVRDRLRDARYAIRRLTKTPSFAVMAILVLSLAMCASVSMFAFVDAALIRPLPYANRGRLVAIFGSVPGTCPRCRLSYLDYLDLTRLTRAYRLIEAFKDTEFTVGTGNAATAAAGARVSAGFFRTLGVHPAVGSDFPPNPHPAGPDRVVLLSDALWRTHYGADENVLGKRATLDGESYLVIGVLPRAFHFAPVGPADYWALVDPSEFCAQRRGCHDLTAIAELRDGVTVAAAAADTTQIAHQLEQQYPESNHGQSVEVMPLAEAILGDIRPILLSLLAGAALLLLIALVNITSLLLIRADSGRRDMAIRTALGASRARLVQQAFADGAVVVGVSSILGLTSARWMITLLKGLIPSDMLVHLPFLRDLRMSVHTAIFGMSVAATALLLFGVAPGAHRAITAVPLELHGGTRTGGRTWRRLGSKLVAIELATATMLLVGAGLLGQSMYRLLHVDLGFQPHGLTTVMVNLSGAGLRTQAQVVTVARQVVRSVSALPGVRAVGHTSMRPVQSLGNTEWIRVVGHPFHGEHNEVNERIVSADYLQTLGASLWRGQFFSDAQDASTPNVTIINRTLADRYFHDEDPIGRQLGDIDVSPGSIRTVVGVVNDVREGPVDSEIWPAEYRPFNQRPRVGFTLVVRAASKVSALLPAITNAVTSSGVGLAVSGESTLDDQISASPSIYLHRSLALIIGGFSAMAFVLGIVGLYGVIAYSVSQRTREIGVRMALGAEQAAVSSLVLSEAGWLTIFGIGAGLVVAIAAARLMRTLLFGVQPLDPATLLLVSLVMAGAALLASYIPARRAAAVNPIEALRAE
jgi:macrolide transport system ATP-binding/permease protein